MTTNRDLYEKSLKRIYSLSTRQLNMAYITWSYMLMGYEIKEVNEDLHTFTMINNSLKGPDAIRVLNYSASKTISLKANLMTLQNDIEKFYIGEVNKGVSARLLGGFVRRTSINDVTKYNDILKETAKWLYTYNKAVAHSSEETITQSLKIRDEMDDNLVGSRILDLISDVYNVNSKHMETLLSHNTKARPCNIMKNSDTTYSYIYEGVPAIISANSEEEAEYKINQQYISSSMKKWDRHNSVVVLDEDESSLEGDGGIKSDAIGSNTHLHGEKNNTEQNFGYKIKVEPFGPSINEKNEIVYDENRGQQYFDFFSNTHEKGGK